ncbi:MAG: hypothetical protein IJE90_00355 [Clostridia bacterium]|nr:hypothetical protein [Clostridia bacterium]
MQKSKLGISVGLLCAILYFTYLFNTSIIPLAVIAYILIVEENIWLKKSAVKSLVVYVAVAIVLPFVIDLIPDILNIVDDLLNVFDIYLRNYQFFNVIFSIFSFLLNLVNLVKNVIFIMLGVLALKQSTIKLPVVDDFINKYMD